MDPLPANDLQLDTLPILTLALLGVVASVGILGNAVILITVWTNHKLRNSTCWFICSLATADIVVLTCVVPFAAIQDLAGHWPYEEKYCDMWIVFDLTFSVASLLSILVLAVDKYLTIKMPFTYPDKMNTTLVILVLACTWGFSFLTIFPPVVFGHRHIQQNSTNASLILDYINSEGECLAQFTPFFSLSLSLMNFVLPSIVMTLIYSKLYLQAKEAADEIKAVRISLECNYVTSQDQHKGGSITRLRTDFKAAFTVGIIMGTYLCCWLPFFIIQIWFSFDQDCCHAISFKAAIWLGYVNSMLNPLIYGFMDKKIRDALKKLLWRASISSMPRLSVIYMRDSKGSRDITAKNNETSSF